MGKKLVGGCQFLTGKDYPPPPLKQPPEEPPPRGAEIRAAVRAEVARLMEWEKLEVLKV